MGVANNERRKLPASPPTSGTQYYNTIYGAAIESLRPVYNSAFFSGTCGLSPDVRPAVQPPPAEAPIRNPDARAVPMYYLSRSRRLRPIDSRQKSEIALAIVFSSCNATGLIR